MIIDCKKVANGIHLEPKPRTLGIIKYGEHKDAEYFCKSIMDMAEGTDIYIVECDLESYDNKEIAINTMVKVCSKIVCCNPFPNEVKEMLKDLIPPSKDIDNFTGRSKYKNCTAEAVKYLLLDGRFKRGQRAVVIGSGVGKHIANELIEMGFTTVVFNSASGRKYIKNGCKGADLIVTAVGIDKFEITMDDLNHKTMIIDVGNDVSEEVLRLAEYDWFNLDVTPKRNGIGLITTKILLKKVLEEMIIL